MVEMAANFCKSNMELYFKKSNLHYNRRITQMHVTNGRLHLHGLARGQHSSEEASQRWRHTA